MWKRVLHLVWALYFVYIVVEVTMNMAKQKQQQQPWIGIARPSRDEINLWEFSQE